MNEKAQELTRRVAPQVVQWRRAIHANPELAFQERETASMVARHLESLGLHPTTGIAETGVTAVIPARGDSMVALRADMDGLPVEERTGLPFASTKRTSSQGQDTPVMHACGHDAHVAILMGVASVLSELREELTRPVKLIFQPAEEIIPEGRNGAERMLEEGALDDVSEIYGLHVTQALPSGIIGLRSGATMASVDELTIEVVGRQTHGAYPWRGIDPIVVASQIVLALQTIPSRRVDLTASPAVVTIGSFHGGVRSNIIPDRVRLEGTIRTLDEQVRAEVHGLVIETARGIAEAVGATAEVSIRRGYPVTQNDERATAFCRDVLARSIGSDRVIEVPPVFGGEDMSFFLNRVPGTYFFLGVRPPDLGASDAVPNHSPHFDVHEDALETGVIALASLGLEGSKD